MINGTEIEASEELIAKAVVLIRKREQKFTPELLDHVLLEFEGPHKTKFWNAQFKLMDKDERKAYPLY